MMDFERGETRGGFWKLRSQQGLSLALSQRRRRRTDEQLLYMSHGKKLLALLVSFDDQLLTVYRSVVASCSSSARYRLILGC